MFGFSNYPTKSKYSDNSDKLVIKKVKDETWGDAVEAFLGLKTKMYMFLVDDNSKHKSAKCVNRILLQQ